MIAACELQPGLLELKDPGWCGQTTHLCTRRLCDLRESVAKNVEAVEPAWITKLVLLKSPWFCFLQVYGYLQGPRQLGPLWGPVQTY
jgi:hypothetical protein